MRTAWLPITVLALALLAPAAAAQDVTIQLTQTPDVVVTSDFEGEERTTPQYIFTAQARVTNGDSERNLRIDAVTYLDKSITGCPEKKDGVRQVAKFAKNRQLDPRQTVLVGGLERAEGGEDDRYWPMEVFRKYPAPGGGTEDYPKGEHTFCIVGLVTGSDPACDKPAEQVCTLAKAPFRAYVRHTNDAPWIKSVQVSPEQPRPGQELLFQAEAQDNDTEPKPDQLTYSWNFGPETKTGKVNRFKYTTPGEREVVLTVTDGHVTVNRTIPVTVAGAGVTPGDGDGNGTPGPGAIVALGVLAVAAIGATRRRC